MVRSDVQQVSLRRIFFCFHSCIELRFVGRCLRGALMWCVSPSFSLGQVCEKVEEVFDVARRGRSAEALQNDSDMEAAFEAMQHQEDRCFCFALLCFE